MINRLLIANRGEIARRIMRTCRAVGIETVAVFSDADADAAFVQDADVSVAIGGNTPAESYLRVDAIIAAAHRTGADAIHPGYGFLSENSAFAQAVIDAGLVFVGPRPDAIAAMGSKLEAKRLMGAAGVPLLPSARLTGLDADALERAGEEVGYPLLIKASAGGGGRGMRVVDDAAGFGEAVVDATREASSSFGDGTVYAERYLSPSRHVEVQIFGDDHGTVVHFHERDCSVQRRHQKIIEEAPAPTLDDDTRSALYDAAVRAGEAIGYTNAGTVEFILGPAGDFYFLEINTRLQVEHPVTEAILGVDLVELQLSVAAGGTVPAQTEIGPPAGHAIEARLYAEDPTADYRPSTGTIHALDIRGETRVDSAIAGSGEVSQYYDPMIAKIIVHAPDRDSAGRRLAGILAGATIDGVTTNRNLLVRTLRHEEFIAGRGDSSFLERHDPAMLGRTLLDGDELAIHAAAGALALQSEHRAGDAHTASVSTGFRNVATAPQRVSFSLGDTPIEVAYRFARDRLVELTVDGEALAEPVLHGCSPSGVDIEVDGVRRQVAVRIHPHTVSVNSRRGGVDLDLVPRFVEPADQVEPGSTVATMPGTIVAIDVAEGDTVEQGDRLVVMEAMKMELSVTASMDGVVTSIPIGLGDNVTAGAVLVVIE